MNNKLLKTGTIILLVVSLIILSACIKQNKYKHLDLPDNQLSFTSEGGTVTYKYTGLHLDDFVIDGKTVPSDSVIAIYNDSTCVGCKAYWVSFIYPSSYEKVPYDYTIVADPNPSNQSRTAKITFFIPGSTHYDCELYVHQAGK